MRNLHLRYPLIPICTGLVAVLAVIYIGLIATVMSYAALTIEFSQSVRNDEATIATLESRYLAAVAEVTATDYDALGYRKPARETFVPGTSATALR